MEYVYNIENYECVGDSLGKINYNFYELNNNLCALSANYFFNSPNIFTIFSELSSKITNLNIIGDVFNFAEIHKQIYTATKLLSSYWCTQEVTIQYPVNFLADGYDGVQNYYLWNISNQTLINVAKNYLDANFPASRFFNGYKMNVSFILYSNSGTFQNSENSETALPVVRRWYITFVKNDVHVTNNKNVKFECVDKRWVFVTLY